MNYYYRFGEHGTCKVICTRCFMTVGIVNGLEAVRKLESAHRCAAEEYRGSIHIVSKRDERHALLGRGYPKVIWPLSFPYLLLIIFLILFALPTVCEFDLFRYSHLRYPCILFGNCFGCASLFVFFQMRKTAVILYLLLAGFESYLLAARVVTTNDIPWFMDLIPSLIVAAKITQLKFGRAAQRVAH